MATAKEKIGPIKKGALHKDMGVAPGKPIPAKAMDKKLSAIKKKKTKSAADVTEERRLIFAENFGKKKK